MAAKKHKDNVGVLLDSPDNTRTAQFMLNAVHHASADMGEGFLLFSLRDGELRLEEVSRHDPRSIAFGIYGRPQEDDL